MKNVTLVAAVTRSLLSCAASLHGRARVRRIARAVRALVWPDLALWQVTKSRCTLAIHTCWPCILTPSHRQSGVDGHDIADRWCHRL